MIIYLAVGQGYEDHVVYGAFTKREDAQNLLDNLLTYAFEYERSVIDKWKHELEQAQKWFEEDPTRHGLAVKDMKKIVAALRRGTERDKNWWIKKHHHLKFGIEEFDLNDHPVTREEHEEQRGDFYYI